MAYSKPLVFQSSSALVLGRRASAHGTESRTFLRAQHHLSRAMSTLELLLIDLVEDALLHGEEVRRGITTNRPFQTSPYVSELLLSSFREELTTVT